MQEHKMIKLELHATDYAHFDAVFIIPLYSFIDI